MLVTKNRKLTEQVSQMDGENTELTKEVNLLLEVEHNHKKQIKNLQNVSIWSIAALP
jgi:hypothetical protein